MMALLTLLFEPLLRRAHALASRMLWLAPRPVAPPSPSPAPSSPTAPSSAPDPDPELVRQAREALALATACEALRCPRCSAQAERPARAALCLHAMADGFLGPRTPATQARMLELAVELGALAHGQRWACDTCGASLRVHFGAGAVAITAAAPNGRGAYHGRPS